MNFDLLFTLMYFLLALIVLIVVHEFGHFLVARLCGVKVLRFSFGFGYVLARWHDKRGTEFAWSVIPLGGYVKMLDETEEAVPASERHLAFNNKSVWARIAIVIAGPLFNLIFAFIALWLMLVIGMKSLAPMIDSVQPGSIAAHAGLHAKQEIVALNGNKINSWHDFQYAFMPLIGTTAPVELTVKSMSNKSQTNISLPLSSWQLDSKKPDILASLGITPFVPSIPPIVGEVVAKSPAETTGIQVGDKITTVDGTKINDWLDLVDYVKRHPDKDLSLVLQRTGQVKTLLIHAGSVNANGRVEGFIGLRSKQVTLPDNWLRLQRESPMKAIGIAFKQTVELTGSTFTMIGRLLTGKLPLQSLSGPVGIAQGAGDSARSGLPSYLFFLALVSISLGVLNLLPIPMLDGGHLLYCLIEIILRRPLSDKVKSLGMYLGLLFMVAMMFIALTNDVTRLVS